MTICIGLVPNKKTVMMIQDSEMSYSGLGFTQDIMKKMQQLNSSAVTGVIGNPLAANEVIDSLNGQEFKSAKELHDAVENAYHKVRAEKLSRGVLAKYGFRDISEVTQVRGDVRIDPAVRENILNEAGNAEKSMGLDLMLASNIDGPKLYLVQFPGVGILQNSPKTYLVSGSGTIMAIDKMGEELENYRWEEELTDEQGIEVLMRAGKASEKHAGVGGPFEIRYVTKDGESAKIVTPDQKKINMAMYLFPLKVEQDVMTECIKMMKDDTVKAEDMAKYITTKVRVGVEFDHYFGLD